MDLAVDASRMTNSDEQITIWDSRRLNGYRRNPMFVYLSQTIDEMGKGSRVAQGLNSVLTSVQRLHDNPSARLYLLCSGKKCFGLIKVGPKRLFIRSKAGQLSEIEPLCVLDFYVHESQQRTGYGRLLYDTMIQAEGVEPAKIGYDRPSPKFLSFLRKHFNLADYVPQSNNFVVFNQYFEGHQRAAAGDSHQRGGGVSKREAGRAGTSVNVPRAEATGERAAPFGASLPGIGARPGAPMARTHANGMRDHQQISSAPTLGLSSSNYAGSGSLGRKDSFHAPATSSQMQRTQRPMMPTTANSTVRSRSPTRSSASYNIISGHADVENHELASTAGRPAGRRSHQRGW